MNELPEDLEFLQDLLDRSHAAAGSHLRSIFTEERRLSAEQVVAELRQVFEMHIGLVTSDGAPLVAPIDGILYRGRICFGFPGASVRAKLVRRDAKVSASYQKGDAFAFIVHGVASEIRPDDPLFAGYSDCVTSMYTEIYGPGWAEWNQNRDRSGEFNGFIEPRALFVKG